MVPESQNGCVDITLQVMGLQKGFRTRRTGLTGVLRDDCGDQRQGSGLEAGVTWLQDCTYFSSLSKQTHIGKGFIFHLTSFRLQTILDHSPPSLTRVNAVCNAPAQNTWALPGNWGRGWAGGRYEGARMLFWKIWGHHVLLRGRQKTCLESTLAQQACCFPLCDIQIIQPSIFPQDAPIYTSNIAKKIVAVHSEMTRTPKLGARDCGRD